jgi:predicted MFS family arabinose efflux permease
MSQADKGSRRNVLAVYLTIWSAATAVCGLAQSFAQLLMARIGVAVGADLEASKSMI